MLNRHINTKHNDHKITICYKVFSNSTHALMHTAKEHTKNIMEEFTKINSAKVKDLIISDCKENPN